MTSHSEVQWTLATETEAQHLLRGREGGAVPGRGITTRMDIVFV